jgi:hypothetical protein
MDKKQSRTRLVYLSLTTNACLAARILCGMFSAVYYAQSWQRKKHQLTSACTLTWPKTAPQKAEAYIYDLPVKPGLNVLRGTLDAQWCTPLSDDRERSFIYCV